MRQGRHGLWKPPVPSGLERSLVVFGEADSGAPVLGSVRSAETCWFNMMLVQHDLSGTGRELCLQ